MKKLALVLAVVMVLSWPDGLRRQHVLDRYCELRSRGSSSSVLLPTPLRLTIRMRCRSKLWTTTRCRSR